MQAAIIAPAPPTTPVDPSRTSDALRVFTAVADNWGLSIDQQIVLLGSPARSTFFKWKKEGGSLPTDTQERLSHIFSIHKALEIVIPDDGLADQWIKRANPVFGGETALERALSGLAGLYEVRRHLDAQRGG
jgi:hypothetical protein